MKKIINQMQEIKKNKKTLNYKILTLLGMMIFLINNVLAFAVSSKYYPENPLYMAPGETQNIKLILQNLAGSEEVRVKTEIGGGSEILRITDPSDIYLVPAGQKTDVNLIVTIPINAELESIYPASIRFTTLAESETGVFGFGSSIGQSFDIIVREPSEVQQSPEEKSATTTLWIVYAIIITIVIALIVLIIASMKRRINKQK